MIMNTENNRRIAAANAAKGSIDRLDDPAYLELLTDSHRLDTALELLLGMSQILRFCWQTRRADFVELTTSHGWTVGDLLANSEGLFWAILTDKGKVPDISGSESLDLR